MRADTYVGYSDDIQTRAGDNGGYECHGKVGHVVDEHPARVCGCPEQVIAGELGGLHVPAWQ
jgi:hypothetical protein